jgi:hypothetical protein
LRRLAFGALFTGDEVEEQRFEILLKYQSRMDDPEKSFLTTGLINSLQGTRTRTLDSQANVAIWILNRLDPFSFGAASLVKVAAVPLNK